MGTVTIYALRVVLALGLAGSFLVQGVMVPVLFNDLEGADPDVVDLRIPLVVLIILGILTVQVSMVCVWRLATMVRSGTVFSHGAFRYVDIIIGAIATASLLFFVLGFILAPGDTVAPGIVFLIGGAGGLVAGVALVVLVLRMLLAQAVARDAEAAQLQAELDEVI